MSTMLIGFAGTKGSGKNTAASIVAAASQATVHIMGFADPLKQIARRLYDLSPEQTHGALKETVDPRWEKTPREIMQVLGTEVGRGIHAETWVRAARREWSVHLGLGNCVVVADVRYPNEVKTIREDGGVVWRIRRPGLVPTVGATHTSEALALGPAEAFDGDIDNDGTVEDLAAKLKPMLVAFGWPTRPMT